MKKTGLKRLEIVSPEKFTNQFSMKIRRFISPALRKLILLSTFKKIIIEQYPDLDCDSYIFCSTHYFFEDSHVGIGFLDRNAWTLFGTTDQLEHNPLTYAAWLNGLIYVDRNDEKSRKDALKKMEFILNNGSSVLIYPEGGWNNTENLLVQTLFASPYKLCCATGKKVVPVAIYKQEEENSIYVRAGDPLDLSVYDKKEALRVLRDEMGSLMYKMIEEHSTPIIRSELTGDIHLEHMERRRKEYMNTSWTRDVWDEELTVYKDKTITTFQEVNKDIDNVRITIDNAGIYAPFLLRREEDIKYDFKKYMKKYWNK